MATAGTQGDITRVETHGIDYIPESERSSSPRNVFTVLLGAQLCFTLFIWGWLPITYGLGWWSTVTASVVGLAIGSILIAPVALFGPKTGTNTAVSSGAFFGVRGRLVGSVVALFTAIGAYALTIWTSGQAVVAAAHRLFGWSDGPAALAVGYAVITLVTVVVALYGHGGVVAVQNYAAPAMGLVILCGFFVLAPDFDPSYAGGAYILGSFWPTWLLAVVTAISASLSYAPFVNDYTRYLSGRNGGKRAAAAAGLGIFVGLLIAVLFGAYAATIFTDPATDVTFGIVGISPTWFLLPLIIIGVVGSFGQGTMVLYGTGLNVLAMFPKLSRLSATLIVSAISVALVYLGAFAWNAVTAVSAFITILVVITAPLVSILMIGYVAAHGEFAPMDLQVFANGGGRYWFSGGWNPVALGSWCIGVICGLLFVNTTIYTGPLAGAAGGIDLSFLVGLLVGALLYGGALLLKREIPRSRTAHEVPTSARTSLPNVSTTVRTDSVAEVNEGNAS